MPADPTLPVIEVAERQAFAARLARLRRDARMSQSELAGEDLSASYISLLESGKRQPSADVVALLAARLGCSASVLWEGRASERERRIALELSYAQLALTHGEAASARDHLAQLLAEGSLDRRNEDEATLLLARAQEQTGELHDAIQTLIPLFERSRRRATHLPVTSVGVNLCRWYLESGDVHRAVALGHQALDATIDQGLTGTEEYYRLAATLLWAHHEIGDLSHAMAWARSLIQDVDSHGTAGGQAAIYWNAALVADSLGEVNEALHLSDRALARISESANSRDLVRLRIAMAQLLLGTEPPRAAEAWQTLSLIEDHLADLGSEVDRVRWGRTAAAAQLLLGNAAAAHALALAATARKTPDEHEESAATLVVLADVEAALGLGEAALERYRDATHVLDRAPRSRATARTWRDLGDRFSATGHAPESSTCYERALTMVGLVDRTAHLRAASRAHSVMSIPRP
jgi:tetratricopeptide (TPR) repeat protein